MKRIRRKLPTMTQTILHEVGLEMKANPPKIVMHTRAKYGKEAAEKQQVAILLNKARRKGARIKKTKRLRKSY